MNAIRCCIHLAGHWSHIFCCIHWLCTLVSASAHIPYPPPTSSQGCAKYPMCFDITWWPYRSHMRVSVNYCFPHVLWKTSLGPKCAKHGNICLSKSPESCGASTPPIKLPTTQKCENHRISNLGKAVLSSRWSAQTFVIACSLLSATEHCDCNKCTHDSLLYKTFFKEELNILLKNSERG